MLVDFYKKDGKWFFEDHRIVYGFDTLLDLYTGYADSAKIRIEELPFDGCDMAVLSYSLFDHLIHDDMGFLVPITNYYTLHTLNGNTVYFNFDNHVVYLTLGKRPDQIFLKAIK